MDAMFSFYLVSFLLFFNSLSSLSSANVDSDCRTAYDHTRIEADDMQISGIEMMVDSFYRQLSWLEFTLFDNMNNETIDIIMCAFFCNKCIYCYVYFLCTGLIGI